MRIRLTRKLALCINGVDISGLNVGDVVDLPESNARMLLLEGWAELPFDRMRVVAHRDDERSDQAFVA